MKKEGKDLVYWERNQLVAHLSKLYPSWLEIVNKQSPLAIN